MFKELQDKMNTGVLADMGITEKKVMTQSTQEKLDSVKAALEMAAKHKYGDGDYTAFFEAALTTLQSLEADIASEEMVEKVGEALLRATCDKFGDPYPDRGVGEIERILAKAAIKVIKGG